MVSIGGLRGEEDAGFHVQINLWRVQSVARTENEKILATSASSEAPLERQKMIILFMKIRLLSLQIRAICNCVFMLTRALKSKRYRAGAESDLEHDF